MESNCDSPGSFVSWTSNVTKCSNPVFNGVMCRSWSNSSMQQDALTVLTGITDLIRRQNGKESSAEYYAALLTALNTPSNTKAAEAYLLKLVMSKAIPDALLRATFSEASKIIIHILTSSIMDNPSASTILKSLLICLGRLLRAQGRDAWSTESVRYVFRYILRFVDNEKPAIRKASHTAVLDILIGNLDAEETGFVSHPASHQTQDYLCSSIRREARQLVAALHTKETHCTRLLHCIELVTGVLHVMSTKDLKAACECILELVEFPNSLVVSRSFDALHTLFENQPSSSCLSLELTARLLTALYACRPNDPAIFTVATIQSQDAPINGFAGLEKLVSWINCVRSGFAFLCSTCNNMDQSSDSFSRAASGLENLAVGGRKMTASHLLEEHLDRLVKTLLEILTSTPLPKLRELVSETLDSVFMNELNSQLINGPPKTAMLKLLSKISCLIKDCLTLSRAEVWPHALTLSARLIRIWPYEEPLWASQLDLNVCELLRHVVRLRDALVDGPQGFFSNIKASASQIGWNSQEPLVINDNLGEVVIDELDRVCLVALETMGPEVILAENLIPLEPIIHELEAGSVDLRRSWVLPLLVRVIPRKSCRLRFFTEQMLPLADRALTVARTVVADMAAKQEKVGSAALITASITVTRQIWAGLSMFVRQAPQDWSELSTGGFGRRLVRELTNTSALRPTVLMALRRLALAARDSESGLVAMRGGAKLAIPSMLSLYENSEQSSQFSLKQQIRATLAAYLPCLTSKVIASPATLAYQKLKSTENPIYMEILQMVIPHTTVEEIAAFLAQLTTYLSPTTCPSRVLLKRAYRLLELICSGSTDSARRYLSANLDALIDLLHELNNQSIEKTKKSAVTSAPTRNPTDAPTDVIADQLANLSFVGMHKAYRKKSQNRLPWKPRLRCLYYLLCRLVAREQAAWTENCTSLESSERTNAIQSEHLRRFANLFLPEILAAICEVNGVVRDLAGRLLVNLVMAFAGQALASENALPGSSAAVNILDTKTVHSAAQTLGSDDSNVETRSAIASSLGHLKCVDEDDIRSTLSMPRGGTQSLQLCQALNLVISRLWGCLPPHVPMASNPAEFSTQESASRVVCHLLRHLRFRRALAFALGSDCELSEKIASGILSEATLASSHLAASPHRALARAGLQLIRLLLAFVGLGGVGLTDLVHSLQSLHKTQKRPLRFVVKAVLEKMIKKFGRKTIQGMANTEYQKVIRNSARIMARRERQFSAADSKKNDSNLASVWSGPGTITPSHVSSKPLGTTSVHSHVSLPPRVHMPRFGEILAQSSDEDEDGRSLGRLRGAASVRSKASTKRSQSKERGPKSLVEELESVAQTSGLCRRARKRELHGQTTANYEETDFSDTSGSVDNPVAPLGTERRVRFVDAASMASTSRVEAKRARSATTNARVKSSDLWLVEANPETGDVLDLSDPKALARHTAVACDAETAKAMTDAFRAAEASRRKMQPESDSPFPIVNGRIIIDDTNKRAVSEPDWPVAGSDEEDEADTSSRVASTGWSHEAAGASSRKSESAPVRIPGREFASIRARGDMRRPGQPDPYAYIQLGAGLGTKSGKGKITTQERRRLLKAVGIGRQKRKHCRNLGLDFGRPSFIRKGKKSEKIRPSSERGIRRKLDLA
ncbi:hypothetical protein FGIG_04047 [Fasciola gigantica]|uniref:Uncharacterized protein n=1 Tax=Fasciola gigantica TaxID=46835 RepID=A0A504YWA3_FASGI|nr:hypothetical protein FGIG_04047 [Fasciola gigantica]